MSDQIFLVRPEYNTSPETMAVSNGADDEYFSDCSEVEYLIEDKFMQMTLTDEQKDKGQKVTSVLDNNMIEISIETNE